MTSLPPHSLHARSQSQPRIPRNQAAAAVAALKHTAAPSDGTVSQPQHAVSAGMSTFLTNLRLLDLDTLPDWPGFDQQTFTIQKRRIQAVEWALYQLFVLWDPEEAHSKLEQYFPPRDQVQSINLRSALLRCLEQAKKNGVLGRDAVVRRTMLDECRGERLEDVLVNFSSAVLKKLVAATAEAEGEHPAIAQQLALENRGYTGDNAQLTALALAHRVSLSRTLRSKQAAGRQFEDLAELLNLKERGIVRRREHAKARKEQNKKASHVTEEDRLEAWRTVRNNWAGNERWMETLIYGDSNVHQDGILSAPFDRVWRRLHADRLSELEDHGSGLLEKLDGRVRAQKASLDKWQDFRQQMFGPSPSIAAKKGPAKGQPGTQKRGIDLGFGSHHDLHLGRAGHKKQLVPGKPRLQPAYKAMLDDFQQELAQVEAPKAESIRDVLGSGSSRSMRPASVHPPAPASEQDSGLMSQSADEDDPHSGPDSNQHAGLNENRPLSSNRAASYPKSEDLSCQTEEQRQPGSSPSSRPTSSRRPRLGKHHSSGSRAKHDSTSRSEPSSHASRSPEDAPESQSPVLSPLEPPQPEIVEPQQSISPEPVSPTDELADQILASMNAASPSPVKQSRPSKPRQTLSLADRTRLSMARMSTNFEDFDTMGGVEEDARNAALQPPGSPTTIGPVVNVAEADAVREDLASRTRKSLAGFEAAQQKARIARRKSERKSRLQRREGSYFPKVDEETSQLDADQTQLAGELMEVEDMDAVFRSRPRLQMSPGPSPSRHADEEYEG